MKIVHGTILDKVTYLLEDLYVTNDVYPMYIFFAYILICSFTILNMLIGILVEKINESKQSSFENYINARFRELLLPFFENGPITLNQFSEICQQERFLSAITLFGLQEHVPKLRSLIGEAQTQTMKEREPISGIDSNQKVSYNSVCEWISYYKPARSCGVIDLAETMNLVQTRSIVCKRQAESIFFPRVKKIHTSYINEKNNLQRIIGFRNSYIEIVKKVESLESRKRFLIDVIKNSETKN